MEFLLFGYNRRQEKGGFDNFIIQRPTIEAIREYAASLTGKYQEYQIVSISDNKLTKVDQGYWSWTYGMSWESE